MNSHDKSNLSASSEIDENTQLLISDILDGRTSILQWIEQNIQDGKLSIEKQYDMPDKMTIIYLRVS